jgi:hypothetical protein
MKGAGHALCHFIFAFVLAQTFDWGWLENCTAFRGEPRPLGRTQVKTTERYAHLQRETLLKAANVRQGKTVKHKTLDALMADLHADD